MKNLHIVTAARAVLTDGTARTIPIAFRGRVCDETTVRRATEEMVGAGWVRVEGRRRLAVLYVLTDAGRSA